MRRLALVSALVALAAPALVQAQQFGAYAAIHGDQAFLSEPSKQSDAATVYL